MQPANVERRLGEPQAPLGDAFWVRKAQPRWRAAVSLGEDDKDQSSEVLAQLGFGGKKYLKREHHEEGMAKVYVEIRLQPLTDSWAACTGGPGPGGHGSQDKVRFQSPHLLGRQCSWCPIRREILLDSLRIYKVNIDIAKRRQNSTIVVGNFYTSTTKLTEQVDKNLLTI